MPPHPSPSLPIVGIGASAGGLEALEKFLGWVPPGSGLAFVVIQHLDPTLEDLLPELLQRVTPMTVLQARDRMRIEPGCVYVIPPNKDMAVVRRRLRLSPPTVARGLRLPIDFFFRSLAEDRGQRSIGVILSGMGSDGSLGLRAIRERGGLCLAQAPDDARFPSMPNSVIKAGLADLVDKAEALPGRILDNLQRPLEAVPAPPPEEPDGDALERILLLLRGHTGQDFTCYKKSTVLRRIERRMGAHQIAGMGGYARFLKNNPQELELLFKELLIGVTSFFRDPAVWRLLGEEILPAMLAAQPEGRTFRAWIPGCSTGEEAYGLAIIFREALERTQPPRRCSLQIFATDLDRDAITQARHGLFRTAIAQDVSAARLARFFLPEPGGYRIRKEVREMVVFAVQNVTMDPPFTRLDLLFCRNLLIYLAPEQQKKLLALFHYSLLPGGLLCLGSAESIGSWVDQFATLDAKGRLFRRDESAPPRQTMAFPPSFAHVQKAGLKEPKMAELPTNLASLADHVLLQQFAPAAVLINEAGDILYISGRTGKYLEPAAGKANWNIFAMARDGLRSELAGLLQQALATDGPVLSRELEVGTDGGTQAVSLTIQRMRAPGPLQGMVMVVFRDRAAPVESAAPKGRRSRAGGTRAAVLELELLQSRTELHGLQQEMQTSQEELKSTVEELQSTNEELQSTNEELTTSREELQSLNEELQTINAEQQTRMEELARTSSDMKNLLDSTDIATVFLDQDLKVARFTTGASRIYKLIPGDVGRPLTDITTTMVYADLPEDALAVLRTLVPLEKRVATRDRRWFSVRIMPYRTPDNRIDGLVLTFTDTTLSKQLESQLRDATGQLRALLDHLAEGYALCAALPDSGTVDGRLLQINPAFARVLPGPAPELPGPTLREVLPALGPILDGGPARIPAPGEMIRFDRYLRLDTGVFTVKTYGAAPDRWVCLLGGAAEPMA